MIPLRPLSITEMLDGAFTAIKWNPKTILVASAAVAITVNLVAALATYLIEGSAQPMIVNNGSGVPTFHAQTLILVIIVAVLDVGVTVLGNTILTGLLTVTVGQAVLGRKETLGSAWRATRGRFWPLLGTVLLIALFLGGGWALAMVVSVGGAVTLHSRRAPDGCRHPLRHRRWRCRDCVRCDCFRPVVAGGPRRHARVLAPAGEPWPVLAAGTAQLLAGVVGPGASRH